MSTSCRGYIGYTVNLKENLTNSDFDFFEQFLELHGEYNLFDCEGKVVLVEDGMCGEYARLIFVDEKIDECWIEGKDYFLLRNQTVPNDIYDELNKAYTLMYGKKLDKNIIEYALWFEFV